MENCHCYRLDVDDEIVTNHILVKGNIRGHEPGNFTLDVQGNIKAKDGRIDGKTGHFYHLDVDDQIITKHILVKGNFKGNGQVSIAGSMQIKENEDDPLENILPGTILNDVYIRSSQTLKQDIEMLSKEEANDLITKLEPVKFAYKNDPEKNKKIGFIAEKVPDIITNKEHNHVKIMEIVSAMTKVVQEQQKSIELMTQEISELKNKINNNSIQKR